MSRLPAIELQGQNPEISNAIPEQWPANVTTCSTVTQTFPLLYTAFPPRQRLGTEHCRSVGPEAQADRALSGPAEPQSPELRGCSGTFASLSFPSPSSSYLRSELRLLLLGGHQAL